MVTTMIKQRADSFSGVSPLLVLFEFKNLNKDLQLHVLEIRKKRKDLLKRDRSTRLEFL